MDSGGYKVVYSLMEQAAFRDVHIIIFSVGERHLSAMNQGFWMIIFWILIAVPALMASLT
jgi:hypothetical protein